MIVISQKRNYIRYEKLLKHYLKEFPQISKTKKQSILKELNLNDNIPIKFFTPEQLIKLHNKLEFNKGQEALQSFNLKRKLHLKILKQIGLQRAIRVRRGLPIKGRTHSNGKTARKSVSRRLINIK